MIKRSALLVALALLAACGSGDNVTKIEVSPQAPTQALRTPQPTFPPPAATAAPATDAPAATAAPATAATAAPATAAPAATQVPATAAPAATAVPVTAAPAATQAPPAGGAPIHPVVDPKYGLLLGSSRGGSWLQPKETAPLLAGGESYRRYSATAAVGVTTGSAPTSPQGPCDWTFDIELPDAGKDELIALGGDWNALPRLFEELSVDQEVYRTALAEILRAEGLVDPELVLTRIIRADLDGDGVAEVLLAATRSANGGTLPSVAAGDYSLIALRTVVNGKVETTLLTKEISLEAVDFAAPNTYELRGLADLNGDGRLEVIVDSGYYEGAGVGVFEINGTKSEMVLGEVCGV